jgi:hypothetical protein
MTPMEVGLKLIKKKNSNNYSRTYRNEENSLSKYSWKFNVLYGLYTS